MEKKKKLVIPGEHISGAEEGLPGSNAYMEKDDIYSAVVGEPECVDGKIDVKRSKSRVETPSVGQEMYCLVARATPTKAFCTCMAASELEGTGKRGIVIDAVLPVTAISKGYVKEIGDAVRIGDIIKARLDKIERKFYDIQIVDKDLGVVKAFCSRCRSEMAQKGGRFTCKSCGWNETRKVPGERLETGRRGPPGRGGRRPGRRHEHGSKGFGKRKRFSGDRTKRR